MKRTLEELLTQIQGLAGDEPSDEFLSLIEDVSDSFAPAPVPEPTPEPELDENGKPIDWKARFAELDKTWRKRYIERFTKGEPQQDPKDDPALFTPVKEQVVTFESLFEKEN